MNSFGNYIKRIRESKNMTLHDIANKVEVSSAQLSRIETGKRGVPKPSTIKKIAEALEVNYSELMIEAGYIDTNGNTGQNEVLFNGNKDLNSWYKELKYYKEEDVQLLYELWKTIEKRI